MDKIKDYLEELFPQSGTCIAQCDTLRTYDARKICISVCRDKQVTSESQCVAACRDACKANLDGDVVSITRTCVTACLSKPDLE